MTIHGENMHAYMVILLYYAKCIINVNVLFNTEYQRYNLQEHEFIYKVLGSLLS